MGCRRHGKVSRVFVGMLFKFQSRIMASNSNAMRLNPVRWAAKTIGTSMNSKYPIAYRLEIDWNKQLPVPELLHKYGGIPSNGITLPRCISCHQEYHLLFQIDLRDRNLDYLELNKKGFIFIISCLNCATYEHPMFYYLKDQKEIVVLHELPRKFIHEYPVPLEEYQVTCRKLLENEYPKSEDDFYYNLPDQRGNHQLGGIPLWVQDEEHIKCSKCKKEMTYLAMIDTDLHIGKDGFREKGHMFGDNGILYVFVCRKCGIFASKAQGL
jgi:uncharacterized protein YwqG